MFHMAMVSKVHYAGLTLYYLIHTSWLKAWGRENYYHTGGIENGTEMAFLEVIEPRRTFTNYDHSFSCYFIYRTNILYGSLSSLHKDKTLVIKGEGKQY